MKLSERYENILKENNNQIQNLQTQYDKNDANNMNEIDIIVASILVLEEENLAVKNILELIRV